ncbi:MAG TPA: glycosyltransferase family 2 protein [Candidatus Paceibacterota bacterium]|nr:glycosyltransferase family 2 protein [Candidatus Paceibacterota bacterium]
MPKVTVLLVTYNRPQFIGGAIKSVLAQTFTDWEIVISDDSENDATEEVMKQFAADGRVRYFHRATKGTIANSSNFALSKATGTYVAILDDDDWWIDPHKLEKQTKFLDEHPDHIGCGGGFIIMDETGKKRSKVLKPETNDAIRRVALYANPVANSTAMFRRVEGGMYDEAVRQFADWDFWLKLGKKGKLYNFPEYYLAYRMWGNSSSFAHQKENALWGRRIVLRYRHDYPGFWKAITIADLYIVYASLPGPVRRAMNSSLSRLKKVLFSR